MLLSSIILIFHTLPRISPHSGRGPQDKQQTDRHGRPGRQGTGVTYAASSPTDRVTRSGLRNSTGSGLESGGDAGPQKGIVP